MARNNVHKSFIKVIVYANSDWIRQSHGYMKHTLKLDFVRYEVFGANRIIVRIFKEG